MNSDRRLVDSVTELSLTPAPASDRRRRDGSRTRIGSALLSRRAQTLAMAAAVVPLAGLAGMNALRAEEPDVRATAPRPVTLIPGLHVSTGVPKYAADQPKSDADLLKQGTEQYANKQYEEAQVTFQQIKADALQGDDRKQYDDLLAKATSAAGERKAARAAFDQGQQALDAKKLDEARAAYQSVLGNAFADEGTRKRATEQLAVVEDAAKGMPAVAGGAATQQLDPRQAYHEGRRQYREGDWINARKNLETARQGGYRGGLFEEAPDSILAKMDKKESADKARHEADLAARNAAAGTPATPATPATPDVTAGTPGAPATPAVEPLKVDARQAYNEGRRLYREGDWVNARKNFNVAVENGHKPGLFEDPAEKYLDRMNRKEAADNAKHMADLAAARARDEEAQRSAAAMAQAAAIAQAT
ncbi:MAG TPA: hypothetical protein VK986_08340, partial [Tepidisphaeraceae bacterium]|nr:hypothetical protein [Tepidisphaeraceae bacterium]